MSIISPFRILGVTSRFLPNDFDIQAQRRVGEAAKCCRHCVFLMIEDAPLDSELLSLMLDRQGILHTLRLVEDADELRAALADFNPHIILCDFSLPKLDGFQALKIRGELCPQIPLFFHSGSIGAERAERAMLLGATGYAEKGDYTRLFEQIKVICRYAFTDL